MDAETLMMQIREEEEKEEEQTPVQVMAIGGEIEVAPVETVCKTIIIERGGDENHQHEVKEENSDSVKLHFNPSDSSVYIENGPATRIVISPTEEAREVYLKDMFLMPLNHEFYCPNCRVCINKVLFCTTERENIFAPANDIESPVRCWSLFFQIGQEYLTGLVLRAPEELRLGPEDFSIFMPVLQSCAQDSAIMPTLKSSKDWEILKSIVYGGLAELLASLSVVTSAASAGATTLSIVALSVANLIGGLSALGNNLRDLKASQPIEGSETYAQMDNYYEQLGKRENFYLHAFFAILSFLVFGLVPPIAYGFSFHESDDKDLKLAVVAGVSLICLALLGIAKAHTRRPMRIMTYFKMVTFYVTSGVLVSLLTYEAGALVKKLVVQLGWFEPKSNFGLALHEMGIEKSKWGSY